MEKRGVIDENTPQPEAVKPVKDEPTTKQAADKIEDDVATRLADGAAKSCSIKDITFYDHALSPAEVREAYAHRRKT